MGTSSGPEIDGPTVQLPNTRPRASWFWPGLSIVAALVVATAALVVIIDSRSASSPPFTTPAAEPGRGPAPAPTSTAASPANGSCAPTVETALELDNVAGNRIEAVRIYREYGESSSENHAYDDVEADYYDTAKAAGVSIATQRYRHEIELSCADDPIYRASQMRNKIRAQFLDIDKWSDTQVLHFRSWVCPLRNKQGKPAAAVAISERYGTPNSTAYQMMDSSSC